jgi:hypothetical protein
VLGDAVSRYLMLPLPVVWGLPILLLLLLLCALAIPMARRGRDISALLARAQAAAEAEDWSAAREMCSQGLALRPGDESFGLLLESLPRTGTMQVTTEPPGALLVFRKKQVGRSPLVVSNVVTGAGKLTLSKQGFVSESRQVSIRANQTTRLAVILKKAHGTLMVATDPPGARVWINGTKQEDTTPASIAGIAHGEITVAVEKEGFRHVTRRATLEPGGELTVDFGELARAMGTLTAESSPAGASLSVDGVMKGKTPLTVEDIAPGQHELRFELQHYRPVTSSVTVRDSEVAMDRVSLEPLPVTVEVTSQPPGADIELNGQSTGRKTPSALTVEPGKTHRLRVALAGYPDSAEKAISPAPGVNESLSFALGKLTGGIRISGLVPGTALIFDGKQIAVARGRELQLADVPPGEHSIEVRNSDCLPAPPQRVVVSGGAEARLAFKMVNRDAAPPATVRSGLPRRKDAVTAGTGDSSLTVVPEVPKGYEGIVKGILFINEQRIGEKELPCRIDGLRPGVYQVEFRNKTRWQPTTPMSANLGQGQHRELTYKLEPLPATLKVKIRPSRAQIDIDGRTWPQGDIVLPGGQTYRLRIHARGYVAYEAELRLRPGEIRWIEKKLKRD